MTRRGRHRGLMCLVTVVGLALAACGGDDTADTNDAVGPIEIDADRELAGYRRDPAPMVGDLTLPDLTADGAEFALRAEPGEILTVYFGYTNCPDFCPTTLSDVRLATRRMDPADADRVGLAMITVDPDRDLPVLADYVTSFREGGHALGTTDAARLAEVAAPFGAGYEVTTNDAGEIEVAHTTSLYAVDDAGQIVLTWQFGVPIDDLAADLTQLLAETSA
jgi:protein SCO1/2